MEQTNEQIHLRENPNQNSQSTLPKLQFSDPLSITKVGTFRYFTESEREEILRIRKSKSGKWSPAWMQINETREHQAFGSFNFTTRAATDSCDNQDVLDYSIQTQNEDGLIESDWDTNALLKPDIHFQQPNKNSIIQKYFKVEPIKPQPQLYKTISEPTSEDTNLKAEQRGKSLEPSPEFQKQTKLQIAAIDKQKEQAFPVDDAQERDIANHNEIRSNLVKMLIHLD
ncbi:hypothetical protein FGO68_gene6225 [Halteria grandinella]|uniref:Uncharacterized protein n=1 Tax=Halteria grandinella TaxID=5974 RepID=A0A8J8T2L8_HALGN|nr:hypothetical protein FGO68_gene6225 [Halteria grandinella]